MYLLAKKSDKTRRLKEISNLRLSIILIGVSAGARPEIRTKVNKTRNQKGQLFRHYL